MRAGIILVFLMAGTLHSQVAAPESKAADAKDPLGRGTPQSAMIHFLEAAHSRNYGEASRYLDLRNVDAVDRSKTGVDFARQLEDILDDTHFEIASLSRDSQGDRNDGLPPDLENLDTVRIQGRPLSLRLQRIEVRPGLPVWLVSAASVKLIPDAHVAVAETPFEKRLPSALVTVEFLDTPIWRWIVLALLLPLLWFLAGFVATALIAVARPLFVASHFHGPLRICIAVAAFRLALEIVSPSTLPRLYMERALGLALFLAFAWAGSVTVDFVADRYYTSLDSRVQTVTFSVLPLVRQVIKISLYLFALLSVLTAWGYNTSTILAGLGVGGLAVALAAQKTIENLFGGISVIGDRPVLVGDTCRFGERVGTVMRIGLRSTRLRTPDRTVISVPNAQFSAMTLENLSNRDKFWLQVVLNLRRDASAGQVTSVLAAIADLLAKHPKVEHSQLPARLVAVGQYSLDIEVNTYIETASGDEFLAIRQELLLQMLQAVEAAGTGLAVPLRETFEVPHAPVS